MGCRLVEMSDISRGYCNSVHLATVAANTLETTGTRKPEMEKLVVKLYSELSTMRVSPEVRGVPDTLLANRGLAPRVLNSTHKGGITPCE